MYLCRKIRDIIMNHTYSLPNFLKGKCVIILKKVQGLLVYPIMRELPIIIVFLLLIRTNIFSFFDVDFDYKPNMVISYCAVWCFYAYLISATIFYLGKIGGIIFRWIWYIILFAVFTVAAFINVHFDLEFSPTLFVLLKETNNNETEEFLRTYLFSPKSIIIYIKVASYILIAILAECGYRRYIIPHMDINIKGLMTNILSIVFCILIFYGAYCSLSGLFPVLFNKKSGIKAGDATDLVEYPATDIYTRLLYSYYVSSASSDVIQRAVSSTTHAGTVTTDREDTDSLNLILVIGESYNKTHSGLYGYQLSTTPNLSLLHKNNNLFVFNDVITPFNYTSHSMKNMLSCNSIADSENWYDFPYFPTLFKKAGFDVYFWDNQFDMDLGIIWEYALNSYIHNDSISDITYTQKNQGTFKYDGQLFDNFKQTVQNKSSNNFYIFHLLGQHVAASNRFPHTSQFTHFTVKNYNYRKESFLDDTKRQKIADYDNATFYNDHMIFDIISYFSDKNSILVYLSDHGEEIYDYRDVMGRNYSDKISYDYLKHQFQIPFIIWCSNKYKQENADIVCRIKDAVDKPFMIDNLCQILFYIGGLHTSYYHEDRNILSPNYKPKDRLIKDGRVNYEKIISNSKKK